MDFVWRGISSISHCKQAYFLVPRQDEVTFSIKEQSKERKRGGLLVMKLTTMNFARC